MNAHFKYVIVEEHGLEFAILLPETVSHDHAINLKVMKPISAGFCKVENGAVKCEGYSTSLELHARKQDSSIVLTTLLFMGVHGLTETAPAVRRELCPA